MVEDCKNCKKEISEKDYLILLVSGQKVMEYYSSGASNCIEDYFCSIRCATNYLTSINDLPMRDGW